MHVTFSRTFFELHHFGRSVAICKGRYSNNIVQFILRYHFYTSHRSVAFSQITLFRKENELLLTTRIMEILFLFNNSYSRRTTKHSDDMLPETAISCVEVYRKRGNDFVETSSL